ncbi:MAG: putative Ig domain-containing protein [Thermodesulfobacteriota bacterium]
MTFRAMELPAAKSLGVLFLAWALAWAFCACGRQEDSPGKKAGKNAPPVVTRVEVFPLNPGPGQELRASVRAVDPDGDQVELAYRWEVNGAEVAGEEEHTFGTRDLKPGDRVVVVVTPYDGKAWGKPLASQPTIMGMGSLLGSRVEISPEVALPGDLLRAQVVVDGPRPDDLRLWFRWKVNGEVTEQGPSPEYSTQGLRRGDRIHVEVIMEAGGQEAPVIASKEVVLRNRPPEIVSRPPERLVAPGRYRYAVKARDPDGDALSFALEGEVPEGMRIDPRTGLLKWDFQGLVEEPVKVDIRVRDGQGGEARQSYEFVVTAPESS